MRNVPASRTGPFVYKPKRARLQEGRRFLVRRISRFLRRKARRPHLTSGRTARHNLPVDDVPPLRKRCLCVFLGLLAAGCGMLFFSNGHPPFHSRAALDRSFRAGAAFSYTSAVPPSPAVWRPARQERAFWVEKRASGPRPERDAGSFLLPARVETVRPPFPSRAESLPPEARPLAAVPSAFRPRAPPERLPKSCTALFVHTTMAFSRFSGGRSVYVF